MSYEYHARVVKNSNVAVLAELSITPATEGGIRI